MLRDFKVNHYRDNLGNEVIEKVAFCGCYDITTYDTDGEIKLMRLSVCSKCWDNAMNDPDSPLAKSPQLTIPLA